MTTEKWMPIVMVSFCITHKNTEPETKATMKVVYFGT